MSHTYMKDEAGYCYAWTPTLATLPELTPYDGEVDAGGFATDKAAAPAVHAVKAAKGKSKKDADPVVDPVVDPVIETTPVDALDAALAQATLE